MRKQRCTSRGDPVVEAESWRGQISQLFWMDSSSEQLLLPCPGSSYIIVAQGGEYDILQGAPTTPRTDPTHSFAPPRLRSRSGCAGSFARASAFYRICSRIVGSLISLS